MNFASGVGRERVIAGADCGFAQGALYQRQHPTVMWAKFRALSRAPPWRPSACGLRNEGFPSPYPSTCDEHFEASAVHTLLCNGVKDSQGSGSSPTIRGRPRTRT